FFNHPATTYIYTLSLHDALPILTIISPPIGLYLIAFESRLSSTRSMRDASHSPARLGSGPSDAVFTVMICRSVVCSCSATTLWRSEEHTSELRHVAISYAVFCLK